MLFVVCPNQYDPLQTALLFLLCSGSTNALFLPQKSTQNPFKKIMASDEQEAKGVLQRVKQKTQELDVPIVEPTGALQFVLGLLNCFIFGLGVIIAGLINGDSADVVIGLLQLLLPFIGWIWGLLWGVLMVLEVFQKE